ncbi:MAG: pyridoxamine 5'-phosphate oxidase family protein [Candidatus Stygibacter frigidus]|nr:pyridoxamine 5'-phosphate oxidase family protein [Candidatus Stygibacter frigidus]
MKLIKTINVMGETDIMDEYKIRAMRRKNLKIDDRKANSILTMGEYGVLSTVDKHGQPYGVPLNYVYQDGCIYFHAAQAGHKIDNIAFNNRVSFCVVGKTKVIQSEFTTKYESVICFGKAGLIEEEEKLNALIWLLEKYTPDHLVNGRKTIDKTLKNVAVIKIEIEYITGKASK